MQPRDPELPEPPEPPDVPTGPTPTPTTRRTSPILITAIVVVALLAGGALFMSGYSMGRQTALEPGTPVSEDAAFRPFWDTYHTINDRYAGGEVDRDAIVQGAIRGMIEALGDPYSSYLTSDEYQDTLQGISGEFEGIGVEIATKAADGTQGCATLGPDCRLVVVAPLAGSPAERADLRTGDLILAADGVSFDGQSVDGARELIRGPKGSTVSLSIQREDQEPFDLEIVRDVILQEEVVSRDYADGTVGYVRLNGFSDRGATELASALNGHLDVGRTKLILDLRGNPGGYVTAARAVASQFIPSGPVFWEEDAAGTQVSTDAQPGGAATSPDLRIVCLIDGGTASASEIVAGALQDTGRATLVGQTSFGKGTVQQWQELTGEGGAFRLTIARWLTPNKRWIHDIGLEPQVPVELPAEPDPDTDPTLDRALELLGGSAAGRLWPATA
ncbi:MAG: ctpA [Chloroflexota bacterium]|nr:ctpA [Chloroflexota bacterium]